MFQTAFAGRPALIQFVVEHQSTVDRDMALRLLRSLVELWTDWRRRHPRTPLPAIVPCVLYHGPRRWTAPRDLQGLLDLGPEATARTLRPLMPQLTYLLDDLNQAGEDQLQHRPWSALPKLTALFLKHSRPNGDFTERLHRWVDIIDTGNSAALGQGALRSATVTQKCPSPAEPLLHRRALPAAALAPRRRSIHAAAGWPWPLGDRPRCARFKLIPANPLRGIRDCPRRILPALGAP